MESKPVYQTRVSEQMGALLNGIVSGEIRRTRVGALGLAFAGVNEQGLLTISRPFTQKPPTDKQIKWVQGAFRETAVLLQRPVLLFKELSRETVRLGKVRYHVVRFSVYFGEQRGLFDE